MVTCIHHTMHWVYVVKSDDGHIYVGETIRLYKRFNEHQSGRGGANTSRHPPTQLLGLYHVPNNLIFMQNYNDMLEGRGNPMCHLNWNGEDDDGYLEVENRITERYMYERRAICGRVRGGKYTTQERCIDYYQKVLDPPVISNLTNDRPLCKHGYPCEINMKKDKEKMFFTCPLSRPNYWEGFYGNLHVEDACNFWQEYEPYRKAKSSFETMRNAFWVRNIPEWNNGLPCLKCNSQYEQPLWRLGVKHQVCTSCFQKHYGELKRQYEGKPKDISYLFPPEN